VAKKDPKKDPKQEPSSAKEPEIVDSKGTKDTTKETTEASGSKFDVSAFVQGTQEELGKVVWPSRQQLISESLAVLLMVTLSATLVYLVDNFFTWVSSQVF
jgi:preprotein translocase subunit SecE